MGEGARPPCSTSQSQSPHIQVRLEHHHAPGIPAVSAIITGAEHRDASAVVSHFVAFVAVWDFVGADEHLQIVLSVARNGLWHWGAGRGTSDVRALDSGDGYGALDGGALHCRVAAVLGWGSRRGKKKGDIDVGTLRGIQ